MGRARRSFSPRAHGTRRPRLTPAARHREHAALVERGLRPAHLHLLPGGCAHTPARTAAPLPRRLRREERGAMRRPGGGGWRGGVVGCDPVPPAPARRARRPVRPRPILTVAHSCRAAVPSWRVARTAGAWWGACLTRMRRVRLQGDQHGRRHLHRGAGRGLCGGDYAEEGGGQAGGARDGDARLPADGAPRLRHDGAGHGCPRPGGARQIRGRRVAVRPSTPPEAEADAAADQASPSSYKYGYEIPVDMLVRGRLPPVPPCVPAADEHRRPVGWRTSTRTLRSACPSGHWVGTSIPAPSRAEADAHLPKAAP